MWPMLMLLQQLQVPNLDATASTKASIKQRGIPKSLRMLLAGLTDLLRTAVGQPPIYLPLAGAWVYVCVRQVVCVCGWMCASL